MKHYNYIIVGAGMAGIVFAERAANQNKTCLLIEKRPHIGGNCYDECDINGVLYHKYGPHYFRTNSQLVIEYLSQFTGWKPVDYKVLSYTYDKYWSFPINLATYEQLIGRNSSTREFEQYLVEKRCNIPQPKNSEEVILNQVGWDLYKMFYEGYTIKQWKQHPRDLDPSVCARIPIRTDRNNNYLVESFQALPEFGYTQMFHRMIAAGGAKIDVRLGTDYKDILQKYDFDKIVYTGPIDEFYKCCYGPLPYRSLEFELLRYTNDELHDRTIGTNIVKVRQPELQINYPNTYNYTRTVELKHATQQVIEGTTIVREYPADYTPGREAYYPIPNMQSKTLYDKYRLLADIEKNIIFIGRLANYKYYNMDQIVALTLQQAGREFHE